MLKEKKYVGITLISLSIIGPIIGIIFGIQKYKLLIVLFSWILLFIAGIIFYPSKADDVI